MAEGYILLHLSMSSWVLQRLNIVIFNDHPEVRLDRSEGWIFVRIAQAVRYLWAPSLFKEGVLSELGQERWLAQSGCCSS